jgi:small subunit ribosomal protein S1
MSNPTSPETQPGNETTESFKDILSEFEQSHSRKPGETNKQIDGTVITVTADSVVLDIGFKSEGILSLSAFPAGESVKPGDKVAVSVKGRDPEGYYELTRFRTEQPKDWSSLERAFAEKAAIVGTVTGVVKGGVSVDIGVRAFMPASRSGARDAAELEKLVGEEIRCRIIKLDVADEDVVIDRRAVAEEEERSVKERRYNELREGEMVQGTVRSLASYGAFVDIGGVDALLHVSDISWSRVSQPADVLTVGQQIEGKVLKIDSAKQRISIGMKQLQPHPWDAIAQKFAPGQRIRGTVTRVVEFGAFVELEPGVEGLIHVTEMSWAKKVRIASDVVKPGETVDAIILGINPAERRISLGLKQALGDPWADVTNKLSVGAVVEGPVVSLTKFGAFVQVAEGVEGLIHISDFSAEKRINHPGDMLRVGQIVKAQLLAIDPQKRQLKLGIKQLVPSGLDEYIAEHKEGDIVTGRMMDASGDEVRVELGEGIQGLCRVKPGNTPVTRESKKEQPASAADLSSLTSMLQARWKSGPSSESPKLDSPRTGQVRSFRITRLDPAAKKIEVELA